MFHKSLWATILGCLFSTILFGQTFTCIGSGDWTNGAIWMGGVAPGSGASVLIIFNNNATVDVSSASLNIGGLLVTNNATVVLTTTTNKSITISNGSNALDFNIEMGAVLQLNSTNSSTLGIAASGSGGAAHQIAGVLEQQTNTFLALSATTITGTVKTFATISAVMSGSNSSWAANSILELAGNGGGFSASSTFIWDTNAKLLYTGFTNVSPTISGTNINLGTVEINCPAAVAPISLNNTATSFTIQKLNIIQDGAGSFSFGSTTNTTINGDLVLAPNSVFNIGATTNVKGNIANSGTINTDGMGSTLTMNGNVPQTLNSQNLTGNITLRINNNAGVTLVGSVSLPNNLDLTLGDLITTPTNLLTITGSNLVQNASASSHINGPMQKVGNEEFVFPIGNGTIFAPAVIGAGGNSTDTYTATYYNVPQGNNTANAPLTNVSTVEYWDITRNTGSAARTVGLTWESARSGGVMVASDLRVAHFSAGSWTSIGGTNAGNVVTSDPTALFSPFTLASVSLANPLPLELLDFKANVKDHITHLKWSTAHEFNTSDFVIERSSDGTVWETIGHTLAKGQRQSNINAYSFDDLSTLPGLSYYRLKIVDHDGQFNYSHALGVNNNQQVIRLYPNPANDFLVLSHTLGEAASIQILDQQGILVRNIAIFDFQEKINISELPSGTYTLSVRTEQLVQSIPFIKR